MSTSNNPHELISHLITAHMSMQLVYVAAKLRIADLLASGPRTVGELAQATKTHERSLYRLLRALASLGVFAIEHDGRVASTPAGDALRSDAPGSQWAMAIMTAEELYPMW